MAQLTSVRRYRTQEVGELPMHTISAVLSQV